MRRVRKHPARPPQSCVPAQLPKNPVDRWPGGWKSKTRRPNQIWFAKPRVNSKFICKTCKNCSTVTVLTYNPANILLYLAPVLAIELLPPSQANNRTLSQAVMFFFQSQTCQKIMVTIAINSSCCNIPEKTKMYVYNDNTKNKNNSYNKHVSWGCPWHDVLNS